MVVGFLMIFLLIFAAGFICGHYFGRKSKRSSTETTDHPSASQPVALYEDVIPSAMEHQEQKLELKENVAYGPAKFMHGHEYHQQQ